LKKTLIALALIALSGASFAQTTTCNGTGACSPPTNTNTVGDNRNGQIAAGGSIANGAAVTANGGVSNSTNTNTNTTGASTSTAAGGAGGLGGAGGAGGLGGAATIATGAVTNSVNAGTHTATSTVGNTTSTGGSVGNLSTGASTSSSGGNTLTGGAVTATNGGNSLTGGAVTVNTVDTNSLGVAKEAADAVRYAADHQLRNTPNVNAAALTSSNDTCMGSVSAGGSGPGFGISVGSTYKDGNCVMLKNSRELWNMGFKAAAVALMCTDAANKEALELTGFICPQTAKEQRVTVGAAASPQYTDPMVRSRLGLPPLK
jgi:hypothetical protein